MEKDHNILLDKIMETENSEYLYSLLEILISDINNYEEIAFEVFNTMIDPYLDNKWMRCRNIKMFFSTVREHYLFEVIELLSDIDYIEINEDKLSAIDYCLVSVFRDILIDNGYNLTHKNDDVFYNYHPITFLELIKRNHFKHIPILDYSGYVDLSVKIDENLMHNISREIYKHFLTYGNSRELKESMDIIDKSCYVYGELLAYYQTLLEYGY